MCDIITLVVTKQEADLVSNLRTIGTRFYDCSESYINGYQGARYNEQFTRITFEVIGHITCAISAITKELHGLIEIEKSDNPWPYLKAPHQCEICNGYHGNNTLCMMDDRPSMVI